MRLAIIAALLLTACPRGPAIRYTETWYDRAERRSLDADGGVLIEQETGFTAIRRVSLNLSTGEVINVDGGFHFRRL